MRDYPTFGGGSPVGPNDHGIPANALVYPNTSDAPPVGGVTDKEANAIARGVREMAHTIRGLRKDLAQLEAARAKWTAYAQTVEVELNDMRLVLESREQDIADLRKMVERLKT